jgi:anti-sigma factor RsiW
MTCPKNADGSPAKGVPSCKDICEFLCDYLEGDLPESKRAPFAAHLKACPPCAEYLHQYEATIKLARKCMCPEAEKVAKQVAAAGGLGAMPEGWDPQACDKIKAALASKPPPPDDMVRAIMKAMGMGGTGGCQGKSHD